MAQLSQIKLGADTYDIAAHALKYAPILDTQEKLDGFLEANTFKTGYWNSFTPTGLISNGLILSGGWTSTSYGFQIAIDDDPTWKMWLRQKNASGWQDWKQIPMGDGTGASGTWSINITGSAGSVAWGNVSGKPSSFPPEAHNHDSVYLKLSGGTLTGTVNSSGNMNLYGSNAYFSLGTSSSSSKCYFQTYNATNAGVDDANLKAGFGFGWSNSLIIDKSGNVTIPGDLTVSGGDIAGKASSAKVADAVAWANVTGKPSTFTPSSHTHNYAGSPSAGGPANSANLLNLNHGSKSSTASTSMSGWTGAVSGLKYVWGQSFFDSSIGTDSGDLVFGLRAGQYTSGGTELCLMIDGDYYSMGNKVLHAGNYNSYAATKDHNHDSTYVNVTGDTMSGLLNAHGGISLNSSTPQQTPEYILGIKAFAEGGNIVWQSRGSVSVGYADSAGTCTSLSTNAGSATKAIYFSGGKPVQCNDTINHNISGTAANSNILNINNSANLSGCLQYMQSSTQTSGNDNPTDSWWHVIKMNHGQGDTYYKRLLAFDFWNDNIMTSGAAGDGKTRTWKQVWVEGNSVTGAVWNDYAECRVSDCEEPGRVLIENGDDTLSLSTERLQQFAGISSDTWGFSQGETEKAKTHIAVAGRVLAYPYQDRNNYKPGDCVCAAPGGTVDIMTEEEIMKYPHRIVGIVSCVPEYEEWGGGEKADRDPVKVNGRIWIKVK